MANKKKKRLYRVEEPDAKLFGVVNFYYYMEN